MQSIVYHGYDLSSRIEYFEGYMQITTKRFQKRYKNYYGKSYLVAPDNHLFSVEMNNEPERKALLSTYNKLIKVSYGLTSLPPAEDFSTNIVYFSADNEKEDTLASYEAAIEMTVDILRGFANKYQTMCLISSHIEEYTSDLSSVDCPHIHVLFLVTDLMRDKDELYRYLTKQ